MIQVWLPDLLRCMMPDTVMPGRGAVLTFAVTLAMITIATGSALAGDARFFASLKKLDPATRLEQVCDLYAMEKISRDNNPYRPDRAKTDVISHPRHSGNRVTGTGGAFRSGGRWYRFSFSCTATPDHMKVIDFSYRLGEPIPESKWASYGLWR